MLIYPRGLFRAGFNVIGIDLSGPYFTNTIVAYVENGSVRELETYSIRLAVRLIPREKDLSANVALDRHRLNSHIVLLYVQLNEVDKVVKLLYDSPVQLGR